MRTLAFYYTTDNEYSYPVHQHDFLLRCIPQELPEQKILEYELSIMPEVTGGNYGIDSFGNRTYTGRIPEEHTYFRYTVSGRALRDCSKLSDSKPLPIYRFPSALTQPSPVLSEFDSTIKLVPDAYEQATVIREAVYSWMQYVSGVTSVDTTASEAFEKKQGVCQDFTHIFITLCRMHKIPARYVSGLPVGEGASHAWAEVWANGRWRGMDATRNCVADEKYLKFCTGRDFKDCPIEQGVFIGFGSQSQKVFTKVCDVTDEALSKENK